jgi:peptide-methionine (R)-S-oxide reductase
MPCHRQVVWASVSTVAMSLGMVAMAAAQDPFDAAGQAATGSPAKDPPDASGKSADKAADPKAGDAKAAKKPEPEFVRKSLQEWQRILPRGVFQVTRLKATEPPFSGRYAMGHFDGTFLCACCEADLFSSKTKFDSGTGWPSFWQPIKNSAIDRAIDNSEAEARIEVMCHRCGAHLGHVFDDAIATPTGLRYCINSLSLKLKPAEPQSARPASTKAGAKSKVKTARGRSKSAAPSSRAKDTPKPNAPDSSQAGDTTPGSQGKPAAGPSDE